MDVKVNINMNVKVKLSNKGIDILRKRHDDLNEHIELRGGKGFGEFKLDQDEDGYTTFQMWNLMNIFGEYMSMGLEIPFDTDIIVTKTRPIENVNK